MTALQTPPAPVRPAARSAAARLSSPVAAAPARPVADPQPAAPGACDCHYCDAVLPRGRPLTFCPHCGQNLTVRQCPACSAEVELGWKFCVCCGRGVGG